MERISNVRAILFALSLLALSGLYAVFTRSYDAATPDAPRGVSKVVRLQHERERADGAMAAWQDESHLVSEEHIAEPAPAEAEPDDGAAEAEPPPPEAP
jgi:outer membrane biosynthesis protein TonB